MGKKDGKKEGKKKENLSQRIKSGRRDWVPYTIAACTAVILYAVILHLDVIAGVIGIIAGFLFPVFLGVVFAYILNPLANIFDTKLFSKIKKQNVRWPLSVMISYILVLVLITILLTLLISQVVDSLVAFVGNLDSYLRSAQSFIDSVGGSSWLDMDFDKLISSSDDIFARVEGMLPDDPSGIVDSSRKVGNGFVNIVLGMILALYFLLEKKRLLEGVRRLLHAFMTDDTYERSSVFWHKCDQILVRYIAFSILDALIVGGANAIFMAICGMNYVALISCVVGATNLAPIFGPIVGAIVGGLILLLVNPWHALLFLIFTIVIQVLDGYVIKPKLFGDSLGVSGLWILVGIIVGGRMFGVVGILFAIPAVAIISYIYDNYVLKKLEELKQEREAKVAETAAIEVIEEPKEDE